MSQNLSSAVVVIGALRVKIDGGMVRNVIIIWNASLSLYSSLKQRS